MLCRHTTQLPRISLILVQAVSEQLQLLAPPARPGASSAAAAAAVAVPDHATLRRRAAEHIRTHADDFAPFLPYEATDGYPEGEAPPAAARAAVARYCARMSTPNGAVWGGHPEIRALACTLGVPVVVYQAGAPVLTLGPDGDETTRRVAAQASDTPTGWRVPGDATLRLSFHRHYYALGEHYNSVVPAALLPPPEREEAGWRA